MDIEGKKVLVIGTGISGIGAAKLLQQVKAHPIVLDTNEKVSVEEIRNRLGEEISVEIIIGELSEAMKKEINLAVISPGVPADSLFLDELRAYEIPIWGEIELADRFHKGRVLAITGTNGKTTTTALLGQIMRDYYTDVHVVGNIGTPYTQVALETTAESVIVAEISSFQLETIELFRPAVSAILNITPDHLDRHHTMENYVAMKESIAKNQKGDDICVLNYEDAYTRSFGERCQADVWYYASAHKLEKGVYLEDDEIYLVGADGQTHVMNVNEMKLVGIHSYENVMAAIAMAYGFGVPLSSIVKTIREFRAVEHRIEYVATKKGVDYYNDSKGTNPDAAIKGIQAMSKPTVLIGGGYDKQSEYDEWIEAFDGKVKWLILIGQTKEKIAACAREHQFENILFAEDLPEVIELCREKTQPGDAVLLSPACASWGMFKSYEVRGNLFKELVNQLEE